MQVESSFAGKAPARGVEVSTAPFGSDVPLGEPSWYQNLNTPYYNASHIAWRAKLRDFFEKEVEPSASSRGSRLVVFLAFDRRGAFRWISEFRGLTTDAAEARGTVARAPERVSSSPALRDTPRRVQHSGAARRPRDDPRDPVVSRSTDQI